MSAKAAVNSLLEEGYFAIGHYRHEAAEYCNTFYNDDEKKKPSDFDKPLEELYQKGILLKIEPDKEKGEKLIKFQKNPDYDLEG